MKIEKNIDQILNTIEEKYGQSSDIVSRKIKINRKKILYVYLESVSSDDKISNFLMKDISYYVKNKKNSLFENLLDALENTIFNSHIQKIEKYDDVFYFLASGYTIIFVNGDEKAIAIETKSELDRGVTESTSESIVRGPKDSFTENNAKNLGLIRKRIKDPNLWFDEEIVGERSKTKVTLAYLKDIVDEKTIKEIKDKIKNIDVDGILDGGNLREFIIQDQKSAFPKLKSTEKPDLACNSLLNGKIVILVENSPFVLISPGLFVDFLHASEDPYQKSININFTRILRLIAFILTIATPAFYIAITTFNQQMIPNELLISLAMQREGVPFPTAFETIMLIVTFEILRESDIRIPSAMGSAIGIVGALVLGEAAVSAGIISPIVVIIVAITAICGLLFTDVDFVNATRLWRFIFILFSIICGLVGFVVAGIIFITRLCSLEIQGVSYMAPIAPFYKKSQGYAIIRKSKDKELYRPFYLNIKNYKRLGGKK